MNNKPRSARQLEAAIFDCIKDSAETAKKYNPDSSAPDRRTADFVVCLCGALEARGYLELAKAIATGSGKEHLYRAEGA
ncbi:MULTISPECIES: hypothetical protein [Burkholderia]|uniref:hypothetical protein n=1 Tax=Burkholderia TaxID=32008 RepID=UPI000A1A3102|nr:MULTISPECIES: hypothetical protein [Burkholderia]ARL36728.1 hypothetical protein BOC49_11045 [Burkholderia pseudomallei]MBR8509609.1 hypothetical protein [Burkholderia cenocepacia]QVN14829.1 hypothetical protein JYG37_22280 [Burkholderia sp. LAS2]